MLHAAVPRYVGNDFDDCPPGHRFQLYLQYWDDAWNRADSKASGREQEVAARRAALKLPASAVELMRSLGHRQRLVAEALETGAAKRGCLVIDAVSTAPFATGLGLEHPTDNGFAFLPPYGLPYLAGSGVKGVMRRAANALAQAQVPGFELGLVESFFGRADDTGAAKAQRGALTCWDVLPQPEGAMSLEIMTPHQAEYLQGRESPHDSGQPVPIVFLALPPGTRFRFVFAFEPDLVPPQQLAAMGGDWRACVERIAAHAFDWLGFGAKTALGYGAMAPDEKAHAERQQRRSEQQARLDAEQATQRRQAMSPEDAEFDEVQPVIAAFAATLASASAGVYKAGGPFDHARNEFFKMALGWRHERARYAGGEILRKSYKFTDFPAKKERRAQVRQQLTQLDGKP